MKRALFHLLAALPLVVTAAETNQFVRDAAGFLTTPVQLSPVSGSFTDAPATAPATAPAPVLTTIAATGSTNETAATVSSAYVLDDKHKLLPGDRISLRIVEDRTNAMQMLVAESSELDIPYIGRMNIADKTCKELADELKVLLEKDYYYKATIIIGLDTMTKVSGKVYIWGPVRTQGAMEFPVNENFTAGKAILRAGGFGDFADKKGVKVVRKTPTGNVTFKVNMVDVLDKGKSEADVRLEPEDFIIVPQRAFNFN